MSMHAHNNLLHVLCNIVLTAVNTLLTKGLLLIPT